MKLTLIHKLSLGAVLLVLMSAGTVGSLFYNKTTQLLVAQSAQDIADTIRTTGSRLQEKIDTQRNDSQFLSHTPPIQGLLRAIKSNGYDAHSKSTYEQWQQRLQSIFSQMLASKQNYRTIRFIDKTGQEIIVVEQREKKISIINNDQLQNKSHRDYVRKTLKLNKGDIYLSEINLNREHGKISIPHQEVLRSATPIFDELNNEIAGLLIITAEIGQIFRKIQDHVQNEANEIYITNDHGGYLLHPNKNRNYGFDLGKRYRIQEDFPELASMYFPENTDTQYIQLPKSSNDQYVINFTKIPFDQTHPDRFIGVGITELYSSILRKQEGVLSNVVTTSIILAAAVMLIAMFFAYKLSQPIKQVTQIMDDYTHHRKTTIKMPVKRNDEIGLLARSYQGLITKIEVGQRKLENLNENLGSMVAERTIELELNEAHQRSIVENMADGLITSDKFGSILSFNSAAEKIFGYSQREALGKNVSILMPPSIGSEHNSYMKRYYKTGIKKVINLRRELEAQRKSGDVFPLEISISEITTGGNQIFTAVIRDITKQKEMDKMKDEFVSTVSHELRTPLTAIRGSLGLIDGGALGEIPEKAAELIRLANNNTNRLLLLINDILDTQKIESGEMIFVFDQIDILPFLVQVVEENKSYGEQYNIEFVISEISEECIIFADKFRMMQVLANLLSNAAKFSASGDKVEISVHKDDNENILISVTDHGEGIPLDFQPRLFDKFTQHDSTTTRKTGSTGLGLSISKMIVEKHEGKLSFVSHEGEGTVFTITLPPLKVATKHLNNKA